MIDTLAADNLKMFSETAANTINMLGDKRQRSRCYIEG
jgi:hypothetical protein